MQKTVRIHNIADQDRTRREECRRMEPAERLAGLIRFRDQAIRGEHLKRTITIRPLR